MKHVTLHKGKPLYIFVNIISKCDGLTVMQVVFIEPMLWCGCNLLSTPRRFLWDIRREGYIQFIEDVFSSWSLPPPPWSFPPWCKHCSLFAPVQQMFYLLSVHWLIIVEDPQSCCWRFWSALHDYCSGERERERVQLTFTVVSQSLKGLQYSSIKSCFHGNVTLLHLEWERWNVFPLVNNITDLRGNCASLNTVCCLVLASERVVRQHLPYVYWALPCWRLYLTPQKTTTTTTKQAILILPKDTSNRQVKEMMSLNIES